MEKSGVDLAIAITVSLSVSVFPDLFMLSLTVGRN
jgi:hypothetical protein